MLHIKIKKNPKQERVGNWPEHCYGGDTGTNASKSKPEKLSNKKGSELDPKTFAAADGSEGESWIWEFLFNLICN